MDRYRMFEYSRENESIAIDPIWIFRVERHELVEQDVRHWGHAHWGARVAGVCLEGGIDLRHNGKWSDIVVCFIALRRSVELSRP